MYCKYTTVCCYTCVCKFVYAYTNLRNFFSTLWKRLTQKLCGVCMEWAQVIHGNCHLWKLLKMFTVDFVKLPQTCDCTADQCIVVDQSSMCTAIVVVQSV